MQAIKQWRGSFRHELKFSSAFDGKMDFEPKYVKRNGMANNPSLEADGSTNLPASK